MSTSFSSTSSIFPMYASFSPSSLLQIRTFFHLVEEQLFVCSASSTTIDDIYRRFSSSVISYFPPLFLLHPLLNIHSSPSFALFPVRFTYFCLLLPVSLFHFRVFLVLSYVLLCERSLSTTAEFRIIAFSAHSFSSFHKAAV